MNSNPNYINNEVLSEFRRMSVDDTPSMVEAPKAPKASRKSKKSSSSKKSKKKNKFSLEWEFEQLNQAVTAEIVYELAGQHGSNDLLLEWKQVHQMNMKSTMDSETIEKKTALFFQKLALMRNKQQEEQMEIEQYTSETSSSSDDSELDSIIMPEFEAFADEAEELMRSVTAISKGEATGKLFIDVTLSKSARSAWRKG